MKIHTAQEAKAKAIVYFNGDKAQFTGKVEKMGKYRFDNNYEKVYEYDEKQKAYIFIGTYFAFDIDKKMSDAEKTKIVEEDLLNS